MDGGNLTPDSAYMDLDFMNQLLDEGCWLETADKLNLLQPGPSTSSDLNDPSQYFHFVENNNSHLSANPGQKTYQEAARKSTQENIPLNDTKLYVPIGTSQNCNAIEPITSSVDSERFSVEGTELGRRWWIGPSPNSAPSSVKDRLVQAIRQLKECTKDRDVLMQIWVPVQKGGKHVLTTIDQPFFLNPKYKSLASYRNISETYQFQAEEDSKELVGLPGRVFMKKVPEWTPDVRFFKTEEYPRIDYAKRYKISGSLAVPVFERGSGTCLGVVEVVTTTQDIDCHPDLENICKAFEAVDLTSSQNFCPPSVKACKEFCQAAVPEISEILGSVCSMYGLPLALTWAPCFRQGKGGCRHFDEKYAHCISTVDSACFVADKRLLRFHAACSTQFLFLGQGIVGRAFSTNKQCFSSNITSFSKTDYPFSHHAMMFGLCAAIAIPLRTEHTGPVDFVLELFLPKDCEETEEQKLMWDSLSFAIQQACQSLQVIMDKEIQEDFNSQVMDAWGGRLNKEDNQKFLSSLSKEPSSRESSWVACMMEAQQKGKDIHVSWGGLTEESKGEFKVMTHWDNTQEGLYQKEVFTEFGKVQQNPGPKGSIDSGKDSSCPGQISIGNRRAGEKRRTKTEKTISLEVLRQYFAGSLKDAAKSIGVCPTTLKRICRQHGITRWPSRKLKKVGHSLKKLQTVIDSVQGAEGTIQIGSFYTAFPELSSPNYAGSAPLLSFQRNDDSKQQVPQPESSIFGAEASASKSLSSSSQSSGSSISCSTGAKQHTVVDASSGGDVLILEDLGGILKRTHSDAELQLHAFDREEPKLLVRSQSHRTLDDLPSLQTLPSFPRITGQKNKDQGTFRVKAMFGEVKIRFCLQPNWFFRDLQEEIAKRFNIGDISKIVLKYLDDDQEWVLLTCDADLEECKDIYKLSQGHTMKISLHQASQPHLGSSYGSARPH